MIATSSSATRHRPQPAFLRPLPPSPRSKSSEIAPIVDCSPKPKDVKPTHVETTEEVVADGEEDIRDVDVVNLENLQEEQNQAGGEVAASDEL